MAKKSSKQRQKAHQRKLEKNRRKRSQARAKSSGPSPEGTDIRTTGEWPLMECLLTEEWEKPGELHQLALDAGLEVVHYAEEPPGEGYNSQLIARRPAEQDR